jgi:hypothetical protein
MKRPEKLTTLSHFVIFNILIPGNVQYHGEVKPLNLTTFEANGQKKSVDVNTHYLHKEQESAYAS